MSFKANELINVDALLPTNPLNDDDSSEFDKCITVTVTEGKDDYNPLAICNMPLCDDADLECVAEMVDAVLCEAVLIIESDPRGLFCYKFPNPPKTDDDDEDDDSDILEVVVADLHDGASTMATATINLYSQTKSQTSVSVRHWMRIGEFAYNNVISEIRDFITKWQLSPDTKCVVLSNMRRHDVPVKGSIYFVDAHFSRPTPRCPNPLAVAKVRFIISVSKVMQKHYPVMITYRFEGFNTLYYAIGERATNSWTFQRFHIDTILHSKLHFYAEICECRHGTIENPKQNNRSNKQKSHGDNVMT
ncbi:uncharacterized protein Dwil_GK19410 [Drosophila willistoni]|uniref:GK19410 n=1 Tax=Drosophila willistoni TaxID=7260 RepID=B4MQV9_DROWI|nr:uncharacterized protein LOC6640323 [Drosophila willistoni]EDW74498.1 uncharacterized protein Dwil_GK19410 [Drosophila willistoni]